MPAWTYLTALTGNKVQNGKNSEHLDGHSLHYTYVFMLMLLSRLSHIKGLISFLEDSRLTDMNLAGTDNTCTFYSWITCCHSCAYTRFSQKVWQCGGSVEVLPCSRIAHIERAHKPYTENLTAHVRRNAMRVAEVWMDQYKSHVYMAWNVPLQVN